MAKPQFRVGIFLGVVAIAVGATAGAVGATRPDSPLVIPLWVVATVAGLAALVMLALWGKGWFRHRKSERTSGELLEPWRASVEKDGKTTKRQWGKHRRTEAEYGPATERDEAGSFEAEKSPPTEEPRPISRPVAVRVMPSAHDAEIIGTQIHGEFVGLEDHGQRTHIKDSKITAGGEQSKQERVGKECLRVSKAIYKFLEKYATVISFGFYFDRRVASAYHTQFEAKVMHLIMDLEEIGYSEEYTGSLREVASLADVRSVALALGTWGEELTGHG